jgi:hypothetical protein
MTVIIEVIMRGETAQIHGDSASGTARRFYSNFGVEHMCPVEFFFICFAVQYMYVTSNTRF